MAEKFDFDSVYKRLLESNSAYEFVEKEKKLWQKQNQKSPAKSPEKKAAEKTPPKNQQQLRPKWNQR